MKTVYTLVLATREKTDWRGDVERPASTDVFFTEDRETFIKEYVKHIREDISEQCVLINGYPVYETDCIIASPAPGIGYTEVPAEYEAMLESLHTDTKQLIAEQYEAERVEQERRNLEAVERNNKAKEQAAQEKARITEIQERQEYLRLRAKYGSSLDE